MELEPLCHRKEASPSRSLRTRLCRLGPPSHTGLSTQDTSPRDYHTLPSQGHPGAQGSGSHGKGSDAKKTKIEGHPGAKQSCKCPLPVTKAWLFGLTMCGVRHLYHEAPLRSQGEHFHVERKTDMKQADRSMCAPRTVPVELTGPPLPSAPCPLRCKGWRAAAPAVGDTLPSPQDLLTGVKVWLGLSAREAHT